MLVSLSLFVGVDFGLGSWLLEGIYFLFFCFMISILIFGVAHWVRGCWRVYVRGC